MNMDTSAILRCTKVIRTIGDSKEADAMADKAEAQLSALLARLEEAEKVIEPFARAGDKLLDMTPGERLHFHPDDHVSRISLEMASLWIKKDKA